MTIGDFRELCKNSNEVTIRVFGGDRHKCVFTGLLEEAHNLFDYEFDSFEIEDDGTVIFMVEYWDDEEDF